MKRIKAKVGSYTDSQGKEKGKYAEIGLVMDGEHGEYAMLHPYVNLQVIHQMQAAESRKAGKEVRDSITVNFFDNEQGQSPAPHQQQAAPAGYDFDAPAF